MTHRVRVIQIAGDAEHVVTIKGPDGPVTWRPVAKDGADLPTAQAKPQPAVVSMGPGMTFDYEFTPSAAGVLAGFRRAAGAHKPSSPAPQAAAGRS